MNTEISPENVCHFITDHGGKVKNTVLVSHFKKLLNDPETKDEARQKFKECVNAVAVVKTEEGEKYVQLKKKYRTSTTTASSASEIPTDGSAAPSVTPVDSLKKPTEESTSSEKTGNSAHDNLPYVDGASENSNKSPSKKSQSLSSSSPAHDVTHKSKENLQHHSPKKDKTTSSTPADAHVSPEKQQKSSSHRKGSQTSVPPKTGSSEPASKTKDSPRKLSYTKADDTNRLSAKLSTDGSGFTAPTSVPLRKKKEKKENVPPSPIPEHRLTSIDRIKPSLQNIPSDQGGRGRSRVVSMIQGSYAGAVERVRQNFQSKTKNEDAASIALSERSLDSKGEEQDDDEDRHIPSVVLDINEKAWIIQSSRGNMVEMRKLLNIESSLADKKTALHWAAKKGNIDMVHMLLDQKVEINPRSNGGYTPLHFAAMHGHENVITLLLEADADANIRDFSGKQAIHYLKSISLPLQKILFGNEATSRHLAMKEFAAGLRPKLDPVRRAHHLLYSTISGDISSVGGLVTRSYEDLKSSSNTKSLARSGSFKAKVNKISKKSKKWKDDKPTISVMTADDSDYSNSRLSSTGALPPSSSYPNLQRSAPPTPNSQHRRNTTKSVTEANETA